MELIDRKCLNFEFDRRCFSERDEGFVDGVDAAIDVVNNAKVVDAAPVIHAKWNIKIDGLFTKFYCSNCGDYTIQNTWYCPYCGAKMDLE